VSALREYLRKPHFWIALLCVLLALAFFDTCRNPANQITARLYVETVRLYQVAGRPLIRKHIHCRYRPSCSEYSILAVQRYGIVRGFGMTVSRVHRCRKSVPFGTYDPVI